MFFRSAGDGARATRNWLTTQIAISSPCGPAHYQGHMAHPVPGCFSSPTARYVGSSERSKTSWVRGPCRSCPPRCSARPEAELLAIRHGTGRREKHAPSGRARPVRKAQHKAAAPTRSSDQRYPLAARGLGTPMLKNHHSFYSFKTSQPETILSNANIYK